MSMELFADFTRIKMLEVTMFNVFWFPLSGCAVSLKRGVAHSLSSLWLWQVLLQPHWPASKQMCITRKLTINVNVLRAI